MIPDRLWFVIRAAVQSVKHFCQEALLPIIGREHGLCCAQIAENRNTAVSFLPPQMKRFMPEEGILIKCLRLSQNQIWDGLSFSLFGLFYELSFCFD
jgi:hypothetical protein